MLAVEKLTQHYIQQTLLAKDSEIYLNQLHVLRCVESGGYPKVDMYSIDRAIVRDYRFDQVASKRFDSVMISSINMSKQYCITKEKFDIEYEIKNNEDENDKDNERADLSLGEDLETLISRIKNGNLTKETIPDGESKELVQLCLLDKEQRRKMDEKNRDFFETFRYSWSPDVPKEEWQETDYKHLKFSKSLVTRKTEFLELKLMHTMNVANIFGNDSHFSIHNLQSN